MVGVYAIYTKYVLWKKMNEPINILDIRLITYNTCNI